MTINLHQLLATLYRSEANQTKVLIDATSFPTDRYALRSHLRLRGLAPDEHIVIVPAAEGRFVDEDHIVEALKNPELQKALFRRWRRPPGSSSISSASAPPRASTTW